jgi:Uma2 family endonuclease
MYYLPENDLPFVATPPRSYTVEEYMLLCDKFGAWFEMQQGQISWRFNGEILPDTTLQILLTSNENQILKNYTMATSKHGKIISNIHFALRKQLDNKPYFIYSQAPNIYITLTGSHRIPDVAVVPKEEFFNTQGETLNPVILVEVVSPSSVELDKVTKLREYKHIETLQEYLVVSQEQVLVEQFIRETANEWYCKKYETAAENIYLPTVGAGIKMEEIYKEV